MRRRELSEKIERRMERGEEEMRLNRAADERNRLAFERNTLAFERVMAALDRHEAQTDDLKIFIRDMNRRSEKVINDLLRGNREFCKELTVKTDGKTNQILAALREGREESKAHREALLALIDRLPPPQAA